MTNMVTREQLEAYHRAQSEELRGHVDAYVGVVRQEVADLTSRVEVLESSVGTIPRDPNDPGLRRLSVLGVPGDDALARIQAIEAWFAKNFPEIPIRFAGNYYKRDFSKKGKYVMSSASYVEFSSLAEREIVFAGVSGKEKLKILQKAVDIKRGLTREAMTRNNALKDAEKILLADPRCIGKTVKREYGNERGVSVNRVYAFSQGKDGFGTFCPPCHDLRLPERQR